MSYEKMTNRHIIHKQYRFKLDAYVGMFMTLAFAQLVAILLSLNGTGMSGGGSSTFYYSVKTFGGSFIVILTLLWAFTNSMTITSKPYRNHDFLLVSNRVTQFWSNILFLMTATAIATMTAILASYTLRVLVFFVLKMSTITVEEITTLLFLKGILALYGYIFMFASAGYLIGTLAQWKRWAAYFIPLGVLAMCILQGVLTGDPSVLTNLFTFYVFEESILLFLVKIIVTISILLYCAFQISKRLEVKIP